MRFESNLKVRSYECDMYGHVNNATFLNYLEFARVEFLNKMGYDLQSLMRQGFLLPIVRIEIEYKRSAFAGQELMVSVEWVERRRSSAVFLQQVYHQDQLICNARVTWVATDLKGKPISLPEEIVGSYEEAFNVTAPESKRGLEHG